MNLIDSKIKDMLFTLFQKGLLSKMGFYGGSNGEATREIIGALLPQAPYLSVDTTIEVTEKNKHSAIRPIQLWLVMPRPTKDGIWKTFPDDNLLIIEETVTIGQLESIMKASKTSKITGFGTMEVYQCTV